MKIAMSKFHLPKVQGRDCLAFHLPLGWFKDKIAAAFHFIFGDPRIGLPNLGLGFGVWGLGCGVWGLGPGAWTWGLRSGAWGLGLGV